MPISKLFILFLSGVALALSTVQANAQGNGTITQAVSPANFDTTCAPCKDFYNYVNGGWLKKTVPTRFKDDNGNGTFGEARNQGSLFVSWAVNKAASTVGPAGLKKAVSGDTSIAGAAQLVGSFYSRCTDEVAIDKAGTKPLSSWMKRIDAIKTPGQVVTTAAAMDLDGIDVMLHMTPNRSTTSLSMIGDIQAGGLGLPEPKLYTGTDATAAAARKAYVEHVANVLGLLGVKKKEALIEAENIMALEARLGRHQLTDSALRNSYTVSNTTQLSDLQKLAPSITWPEYFAVFGMTPVPGEVNLQIPAFVAAVDSTIKDVPVSTWKSYLKLRLVDQMQEILPQDFGNEYVAFNNKINNTTITGGKRNCLAATVKMLPDAVWHLYVAGFDTTSVDSKSDTSKAKALIGDNTVKSQTELTKSEILKLIENMRLAMKGRIQAVTWMSDSVKNESIKKLEKIKAKFEYPKYRSVDYSGLTLSPTSYAENMYEIMRFNRKQDLAQLGKSSNSAKWGMPPTIVNAYYRPDSNQIIFPVGILVPPFFDPTASARGDDAVNYGAIGVVIGHEITHAFTGPARMLSEKLVQQYSAYKAVDDVYINGRQTLDENLADLGGMLISYDALQIALKDKPRTPIDGFTPEQRFFISFANLWRRKMRPDEIKNLARRDVHSLPEARVNGTVTNVKQFSEAFGCKPGDPLYREDAARVVIW